MCAGNSHEIAKLISEVFHTPTVGAQSSQTDKYTGCPTALCAGKWVFHNAQFHSGKSNLPRHSQDVGTSNGERARIGVVRVEIHLTFHGLSAGIEPGQPSPFGIRKKRSARIGR